MHHAHSIRLPKFSNVKHSFLNLVDIPYISVEYIMILNTFTSKIQELFTGYQVSSANKIICNLLSIQGIMFEFFYLIYLKHHDKLCATLDILSVAFDKRIKVFELFLIKWKLSIM